MKSTYGRLKAAALTAVAMILVSGSASSGVATKLEWAARDMLCKLYYAMKNIVGVLSVLVIVAAGLRWVMSENDAGQRKLAKDAIKSVLIGIAIVLIAGSLVVTLMGGSVSGC
jgi:type IV secretory pathway VirB2 component (pilin)